MPAVVATDFGGILPWTQHVVALLILLMGIITLVARLGLWGCSSEPRQPLLGMLPAGLIIVLAAYGWFQTVPLSPSLVNWLSSASLSAYQSWAGEILPMNATDKVPISIASFDSVHVVAMLSIIALLAWQSSTVFFDRVRGRWLLVALSLAGVSIAGIGLARMALPDWQVWSFQRGGEGAPFGTFPNRNNAALGMNLGLAAALGGFVWQTKFATSSTRRTTGLQDRLQDPWVMVWIAIAGMLALTVLACGSRGGALSMIVAGAISIFVCFQPRRKSSIALAATAFVVVSTVILLVVRAERQVGSAVTVNRDGAVVETAARPQTDARLLNWPDGLRAATHHLPAGSGLATYAYAYLPWQKTSPWRWCEHADNLWLEAFVELGWFGVLWCLAMLISIGMMIRRLARSTDPFDQALFVTGTFATSCIIVSQVFDFGLILPANLISATLVFSTIAGRAAALRRERGQGSKLVLEASGLSWWKSPVTRRMRLPHAAAGVLLCVISLPAVRWLRLDSIADSHARMIPMILESSRSDFDILTRQTASARTFARQHPHPELLAALTELEHQRGRLKELEKLEIGRLPSTQQEYLYRMTSMNNRRLGWRTSESGIFQNVSESGQKVSPLPSDVDRSSDNPYAVALRLAEQHLRLRPLALDARRDLIGLEFVHRSPERTNEALEQSAKLFQNNPELQYRFGNLAADGGDHSVATRFWRRAIALRNEMEQRVKNRALRYDSPISL